MATDRAATTPYDSLPIGGVPPQLGLVRAAVVVIYLL